MTDRQCASLPWLSCVSNLSNLLSVLFFCFFNLFYFLGHLSLFHSTSPGRLKSCLSSVFLVPAENGAGVNKKTNITYHLSRSTRELPFYPLHIFHFAHSFTLSLFHSFTQPVHRSARELPFYPHAAPPSPLSYRWCSQVSTGQPWPGWILQHQIPRDDSFSGKFRAVSPPFFSLLLFSVSSPTSYSDAQSQGSDF